MPLLKMDSLYTSPRKNNLVPARILEVEISRPLSTIPAIDSKTGRRYQRALLLVRLHTQPLGVVEIKLDGADVLPQVYAPLIWKALGTEINAHLQADNFQIISELNDAGLSSKGLPRCLQVRQQLLKETPLVSVVIATHNRSESLAVCINSLLAMEYPDYEIIIVDNAPSDNATSDLIQKNYSDLYRPGGQPRVRYVREDRPGLSVAHNRGLSEVNGDIVAFTDDDVLVDSQWLAELRYGFAMGTNVACVTGMIFPAELETPSQMWIEEYGGFSKGFKCQVYDLDQHRPKNPLYPYTAGKFGSGANMAFKTALLRQFGGFDSTMGTGTPAMGGDDLAAFFEIITSGYQLLYQPAAIVHHWHRRDYAGLRRQSYGYGVGLSAFLMKTLVDRPSRLVSFATKIPYGLYYTFSHHSPKNARKSNSYPRELTRLERRGMLYGPIAYLRSRYQSQQWEKRAKHPEKRQSAIPHRDQLSQEAPSK